MEQALANTNEQTDSVLSRAKQNFVPSSKQLVKDTIEMITNPVQTAKSLYELGSGIVQLAIPGEQGNEDTARAVGQHFADRYGSIEKAKETFATDPAAFALDALGVITGGAAIGVGVAKAGAKAVSKVGRKVDVDDGVADAQLQAAKAAKAKEPDRSGMGDLGDGIQPSVYDEALEVSDKYGNNSIFKDGEFDADEYLTYMDDTKELRNSSTIPNDYGLSAKEFLETLSVYSDKNIIKYEGASYESPGFLSELKSMSNKDPWYHIKENGDVVLHADRRLERPVLGKPKRKKTLKISGGKKQTTKEEILEFLDIDPKVLENSLDEIPDKTGEYKEILFDMDKLNEEGIARVESLADDGLKKGGTVMKLAMGGTPEVAKADGFKDPSLSKLDKKTVDEKVIKKDIEDKVSSVAKKPQKDNTNIQTAMLLNPEEILKRYERPIMANEGAMPVVEEKFTPSDYFKTEMMKQWLFAEGSTGDKDGQETNQAFKGIHINSYPEFAEEIKQGTLTDEQVAEIMYRQYTGQNIAEGKPSKFRNLSLLETVSPEAAKLLFMDAGYTGQNAGAIKDLQEYLVSKNKKIEVDGLLGKDTLEVMNDFNADEYRNYLGTLDRYTGEKGSRVYNRFFTEEERQSLNLYEKELTTMALGGVLDIQKFMDGGLADNADDTPGATESEVADDIPAMISEGELVVPANVVRYHGLSKYENMRKTALNALDELEDNGQIRPVDSDGTPIDKEVKKQTDEVMASKGATVARYNEGGSPKITTGGPRVPTTPARRESTIKYDEQTGTGKYNYTEEGIDKWFDDNLMFNTQAVGSPNSGRRYNSETNMIEEYSYKNATPGTEKITGTFKPEDYFALERIQKETSSGGYDQPEKTLNDYFSQDVVEGSIKGTLTTPEGKDYRVTNPNTKITATGPRTTGIVGGNYTGVDLENMPGFGVDRSGSTVSGPSTGEKLLSGITTVAALDKLFNDGKITESVYNWSKENIFDPLGEFLGFDKAATAIKTGPLAGSSILNGQLTLADGTMDIITSLGGADTVGKAIADGTVIGANSYLQGIPANAEIITRYGTGLSDASHYAVFKDADGATQTVQVTNAQKAQLEAGNSIGGNVVSSDGLFSWKGGLATIGTALSLYDLIENGPSVANVAGLGAGVGGMISAQVFGLGSAGALGSGAMGQALAAAAGPLAVIAIAAGLVEAFSGPPSQKVGEAAYDFDNPNYDSNDILSGGFWTKKRSDENIDAAKSLVTSVGSYVSSMEQALEINIGGELFIDVGNREGIRYSYVDGYDELGMYKYHKKDLDYKTLQAQKGFTGEDSVTDLMNAIQDDTNVVVMFALADKAAGGEGYATYDNVPLYRKKINTLSTYRSGMAGSGTKAVLTDQERNLLEGFQKKEFAAVTGEELAALLPIYDKIAPVQQNNNYSFRGLGS